ncbi:MAG: hydrogenase iron-sulfur subunit [candidate division WOR-3 bacterium]|nr:MAG: hydrogenase iron-sulfur subunit [candidate division WOR-3 bacterium]
MRVLVCTCKDKIKLTNLDLGPDVKIEQYFDLCKEKPAIDSDEKVVIAGCSPNLLETLFPNLNCEFVNLYEHIVLIGHPIEKARDLIAAAVEKMKVVTPIKAKIFTIEKKSVVVIGGGVAAIEVASQLAQNGVGVDLVERSPFLGGTVAQLDRLYPEGTPYSHTLMPQIAKMLESKNINYYFNTEAKDIKGRIGNYDITLQTCSRGVIDCTHCGKCVDVCPVEVDDAGKMRKAIYYVPTYPDIYAIDFNACTKCGECVKVCEGKIELEDKIAEQNIDAGAIVIASGLNWYDVDKVTEYGYCRLPGVMKTLEFERAVASGVLKPKKVVIIYCAGSRDANHLPYCSKICCFLGLKEAKLVLDRYPETQVYVVAMDMRSFGTFEYFYNKLREKGVTFVKGKPSEVIKRNDSLVVRTEDLYTNELLEIEADTVVLSAGFVPDTATFDKLGIKLNGDFPVLFENADLGNTALPRGIFTAGAATFPAGVADSLVDARKAAFSVLNLFRQDKIETKQPNAVINEDLCSICRMCIGTCPYGALSIVEEKLKVNEELCMGCGICSITCPVYASQLELFNPQGLSHQIRTLIKKGDVLALLCRWSAYNATDKAAYDKYLYPENVKIIRVPCSGAVDPSHVMDAVNNGAKGVLIGGCYPDACHYARGNFRAKAREQILKQNLDLLGFSRDIVRLEWIGKDEANKFVEIVKEMNK